MKSAEEITHAFIVRIWLEHRVLKDAEPIWRGVIEHVDSGARVYFDQLDKMNTYFAKYLDQLGIHTDSARE